MDRYAMLIELKLEHAFKTEVGSEPRWEMRNFISLRVRLIVHQTQPHAKTGFLRAASVCVCSDVKINA